MTLERVGMVERAARIWPIDQEPPKDTHADGPLALIRTILTVTWRYRIRLLLSAVVGAILSFAYAYSLPRTYHASATMLLEPRYVSGANGAMPQGLDLNSAESELQIILSERLLSSVFQSLRLTNNAELAPQPPGLIKKATSSVVNMLAIATADTGTMRDANDQPAPSTEENRDRVAFANFVERVSARRVGQSYVVDVGYASSDPALPAKVANAIVSAYILQSVTAKEQLARAGIDTLQGRLDALAAQVAAASDAMQAGRLPDKPTPDADAKITGAALYPLSPSSPRISLITAFGGVVGLSLGAMILALGVAFDRKLREPKDLANESHLSFLGAVPIKRNEKSLLRRLFRRGSHQAYSASVRDLRTSIDLLAPSKREGRHAVIALVGCAKPMGAATLGQDLARVMGDSGRTVTIFTTNRAQQLDGAQSTSSLADVLGSSSPVSPLVPQYGDNVATLAIHSRDARINSAIDFCSPKARETIDVARLNGDVILDVMSMDISMDAIALARYADIVIIVTQFARTSRDDVIAAESRLKKAGLQIMGYVITRSKA
ncbi:Wzz/FepE/Etk N-terminal domain-containing protein [Neorhizobium sp. JUb45]|uniref:Wzz/FepE/Etk N-terminal domain-containing protein n=1 Tax=unclassified Neorhizobium TaxID=2629175 RepID=UPI001048C0AF|nr:Wzz/FepE/Etk N-terminal domain-containing protein [Neorhizobium sp. JUb45]TCQ99970.1 subunit length determinant protein [Neorhizobium sp. JUb45]